MRHKLILTVDISAKVLNNGCGFSRVKVVAISAVTDVVLQIAVIAV